MIQPAIPFIPRSVRIAGAGAYVPSRVVETARMVEAIPGWSSEWIEEKTGMRERRFLWDVDVESGVAVAPPLVEGECRTNTDMCEVALRRALDMAEMDAKELDAVLLVTCTPDRLNFSYDAMEVHRRLGCRVDTYALTVDDGCGGTPYIMDMAYRMIRSGAVNSVAVIGSACTSALIDRSVWSGEVNHTPGRKPLNAAFGMYVFGDAAGAVVLRSDPDPRYGIISSISGNDYQELVVRRAGGVHERLYGKSSAAEDAFVIDGQLVARSYRVFMKRCLNDVLASHPDLRDEVKRYYFHQPNKRLLDHFVSDVGLPADRVACNVDRYGNTSAAGMLVLLAEDLEAGAVSLGSGDLVMIAAVGANVQYGAQLVRL